MPPAQGAAASGAEGRTLIDATLYHRLVIERGWSDRRFRAWLARAMRHELLG